MWRFRKKKKMNVETDGTKIIVLLLFAVLAVGGGILRPHQVQAANPQKVTLRADKLYTSYDITGDKKKDRVLLKTRKDRYGYYERVGVYVNGKRISGYQWQYGDVSQIQSSIYTLANGKPFLYLYCWGSNGDGPVCGIFQYTSQGFKQVAQLKDLFRKYGGHASGYVAKVSGNTISARFRIMSYSLGSCEIGYNYTYKSGTLKRTARTGIYYKIYSSGDGVNRRTFTVNKTLIAYKSGMATERAFTLRRGNVVYVDRCYIMDGKMTIRVRYNGKYGWIKAADHPALNLSDHQFKNIMYAG